MPRVPPIPGPKELFCKLVVSESASDKARVADRVQLHGPILDAVNGDTKSLRKRAK